jgi:hypothetical protein
MGPTTGVVTAGWPARVVILAILAVLAAMPSTADAQRSDSRVWWDEKRKAYPQCNALTNEHERLTDELDRIAEQARSAKEPRRGQLVDQMNATARQRGTVQDKLFACIRASGGKPIPSPAEGQQKPQPPLAGRVEETEGQKPPTDPIKPPPDLPPTGGPALPGPIGPPGGGGPSGGLPIPGPGPGSGGQPPPSGTVARPPCVDPRVAAESTAAGSDPIYMSAQQAQAIQRQDPRRLRRCIPDICNRPNGVVCWLNPDLRTQPVPPGRRDGGRPDGEDLPGDVRAGLRRQAQELRAIRNNPGANPLVAVNEFFRGSLDMTIAMLEHLAQPRGGFGELGTPARQLLDYLVKHTPESHEVRYGHAVKAVGEFQKSPAYALGQAAPTAAAMALGAKMQVASELNAASKQMLAANATTNRIVALQQGAVRSARASGTPRPGPPATTPPPPSTGTPRPPNRAPDPGLPPVERPVFRDPTTLPPTCFFNQCLRNSIQVAKWRRTGHWVEPTPRGYQYIDELSDLAAGDASVARELRAAFGNERAVDPLHGPGGQQQHALGNPVPSSRAQIEGVMRELREHGNGIVLVDKQWVDPSGQLRRGGHIFNVYGTAEGRTVYYDHFTGGVPHPDEWAQAQRILFMRVP